ncbi:hypothetical protein PMIN01_05018 [Paraphaeosphaeria minitans]|uniref:Uncharacterized protein n=1 Tax=Paraphaeosphaeria minitans TaxID=565426 RepID=A0A9P6GNB2_9PLEO|nr:hypothetical protein PMIN01_05018 [Paraphaeosphaeria minitans]
MEPPPHTQDPATGTNPQILQARSRRRPRTVRIAPWSSRSAVGTSPHEILRGFESLNRTPGSRVPEAPLDASVDTAPSP